MFGEEHVTYQRFAKDIERTTRRLAALEVGAARRVLVNVAHPYVHWLLTIALGRMGVVSVTAFGSDSELFRFTGAEVVLTDQDLLGGERRIIRVTKDWLAGPTNEFPAFVDREHGYDDPLRLVLSSGTTGKPKKIVITYGQFQHRVFSGSLGAAAAPTARVMAMVGADTVGGYQLPMATWAHGGRVVMLLPKDNAYITLRRNGVSVAFMSPVQLAGMLKSMPRDAWPVEGLTVSVGGSALPHDLAQQARLRLTSQLMVVYGSTEVGTVYRMNASMENGVTGGYVVPSVEVQVVDSDGQPVSHGQVGEVRVRGATAVSGYADEPREEISAQTAFRDGWFYPGDAGVLTAGGLLAIVGRTQELMNLGGIKVAPTLIEDAIRACEGIADMAAFAVDQAGATEQPWVAVVRGMGFDAAAVISRFKQRFPQLPSLRVAYIDAIPRNGMGKVLRGELRRMVKAQQLALAPIETAVLH
ncbi:acyl-CoA synthetase [Ramlibacter solisilvae]